MVNEARRVAHALAGAALRAAGAAGRPGRCCVGGVGQRRQRPGDAARRDVQSDHDQDQHQQARLMSRWRGSGAPAAGASPRKSTAPPSAKCTLTSWRCALPWWAASRDLRRYGTGAQPPAAAGRGAHIDRVRRPERAAHCSFRVRSEVRQQRQAHETMSWRLPAAVPVALRRTSAACRAVRCAAARCRLDLGGSAQQRSGAAA